MVTAKIMKILSFTIFLLNLYIAHRYLSFPQVDANIPIGDMEAPPSTFAKQC